jgi:cytochrome c oxidase assembly protein subunit 11
MITAVRPNNNLKTALLAGGLAVSMVGLGFAAVPLYRIFCETTGFGGTTMRVSEAQAATVQITDKPMTIRFDANHRSDLPWDFRPEQPTDKISVGARDMQVFIAKNLSDRDVTGTATFNVVPELAGKYFNKVQCFCFTQQTLKSGEQIRMPVLYYVDPKILTDPDTKDIQEITLSYTFYPVNAEDVLGTTNKIDPPGKIS